jgi:penicillin-binding protein 2
MRRTAALFGVMLAGCSLFGPRQTQPPGTLPPPGVTSVPAPDPEAAARAFLAAWSEQDYPAMYALLSPLAQDGLPEAEFTERYSQVWRAAALNGLDFEIVASLINPQSAQVQYRLILHSAVVGDLVRETFMDLKRVDGAWRLAWTDSAILPELAGGNRLLMQYQTPTRANIYDRNGLALAAQTDAVAVWIVPGFIGDEDAEDAMLSTLGRLLDRRPESIAPLYEFALPDWFVPVGEASLEEFQRYEGTLAEVGGVQWAVYPSRFYFGSGIASHAVGYVSQIQADEVDQYQARGYPIDAYVGRTGVEAVFEDRLRGQPGGTLYVTDPEGRNLSSLGSREPGLPQAVYTTLDRDLQRNAQNALAGFAGAIVVLERDTGRVLALASAPTFDPNLYDTRNPNWQAGLAEAGSNPFNPFLSRATHGLYPLGSVFKIITMAAALESGLYAADTTYVCNGEFTELPGQTLFDWTVAKELPDHGELTLVQGLERSCNPYFWHIGLDLFNQGRASALSDMAAGFGLAQLTGIEIGETEGQLPSPEWKLQTQGEEWTGGDSVQLAIGQASLNITPLQVARFIAAVGNGGTLYRPQIVESIQDAIGTVSQQFQPEEQGALPVSEANLDVIRQAMTQVVRADRGTARRAFLGLNLSISGKTGTATSAPESESHAWFAGYSSENREDTPDIAVVVVLEYAGEGSEWAAPVFRRVMESYFFGRPVSLYPWESQIGVTRTPTDTPGPGEEEG